METKSNNLDSKYLSPYSHNLII